MKPRLKRNNYTAQKKGTGKKKRPAPYQMHDEYFKKAKLEGYRARSVYKLIEIQEKYGLIEPHMHVCDIGAAPGSWIQYTKRITGEDGKLLWIDLKRIDKYSQLNIKTIECDIFNYPDVRGEVDEFLGDDKNFDLILSDIAPNTTWRKDIDQYASVELNIEVVKFASEFLKPWGNLVMKVFKWEDFSDLSFWVKKYFKNMYECKPKAVRDRSFEVYIICKNKFDGK